MIGKSRDFRTVVLPGPASPGDLIRAQVESATSQTLTATRSTTE
jgi:hypothetical protein